jgi:uncharacterized YigZ family protein
MLFEDTYQEIEQAAEGFYKSKGSKFYAHAIKVYSDGDVKKELAELRKKYYDARHHCYAYILNPDKSAYRTNDDGEPSGSAGKPIHGQLLSHDLTNILVVVIRYFGGTKLGIPGLILAYKEATKDALNHATIKKLFVKDVYEILFGYPDMNVVMRILKDEKLEQFDQDFGVDCKLKFAVRRRESERLYQKIKAIHTLKIKFIKTI